MKHVAALVALLLCACNGSDDKHDDMGDMDMTDTDTGDCVATDQVAIQNFAFVPKCVKTTAGATVTFTNDDGSAHTVSSDTGQSQSFDSGTLHNGDTFALTITGNGTVKGHCNIHSSMRFELDIVAAP